MKRNKLLSLAAAALLLAGCGQQPAPTTTAEIPMPTCTIQATEAPTQPTEAPTTVPPTEPDPILEAGPTVTVDGTELSGSVLYEDTVYVAAREFFTAGDDITVTGDDLEGFQVVRGDETYGVSPVQEGYLKNGNPVVPEHPVLTNYGTVYLPLEQTCTDMNISVLPDPERNHIYCTSAAGAVEIEEGVRIPILMYHGCTDDTWGGEELFVRPSNLDAQLQYLQENGYQTITFEDWDHLEDFEKPVMLTFDDGYMDNYLEAFPILQKYNAKATIFLITVSVDRDPRTLTSQQAREMMDSGLVSIQSHTATHPHLSQCSDEELDLQIRLSRLAVARICGREPFVLCYPYGDSSAHSRELTMQYYQYGLLMNGGTYTTGQPLDRITRHYVSRYTTLSEFASMVSSAGRD